MITGKPFDEMTFDDITHDLDELIQEKGEVLNTVNIAVNEYVRLKNEYIVKSNAIRLKPDEIQENLGLSKPATEKQQQAYIDDKLKDLRQDLRVAEENVSTWKREVDLLDNKISAEKYRVRLMINIWEIRERVMI